MVTSGIRLGTPACTTRGFGVAEFQEVGDMIAEVLNGASQAGEGGAALVEGAVRKRVAALLARFPIYDA
jgi:glycine hydroxymethyltransferase